MNWIRAIWHSALGLLERKFRAKAQDADEKEIEMDFPSKDIQELVNERLLLIGKHMIPLFKMDDASLPLVCGTGTLIEYEKEHYIATAYHVMKKRPDIQRDRDGDIYLLIQSGMNKLELRIPEFVPDANFEKQVDIVTIKLSNNHIDAIGKEKFHKINGYLTEIGTNGIHACAMGFPYTANKFDRIKRQFNGVAGGYIGRLKDPEYISKIGFRPPINIGLNFNIKHTMTNGIRGVRSKDPNGISGGPIWMILSENQKLDKAAPILLGITTTYRSLHKTIIGTHANSMLTQMDKRRTDRIE